MSRGEQLWLGEIELGLLEGHVIVILWKINCKTLGNKFPLFPIKISKYTRKKLKD